MLRYQDLRTQVRMRPYDTVTALVLWAGRHTLVEIDLRWIP
jgi:hypothetical protein